MELALPVSTPSQSFRARRRRPLRPPLPSSLRISFSTTPRNSIKPSLALATSSPAPPSAELENRKHDLLRAVQDTQRGLAATAEQRAAIEEALVCVEGYGAGSALELSRLDGTWRLNYTTARDVLVLFEAAARIPFFEIGQIYQKFECGGRTDGGIVRNVVRWSVRNLLEEQEGATLLVSAKFSLLSKRNIYLQFEEVWAWERFPHLSPIVRIVPQWDGRPLAKKWDAEFDVPEHPSQLLRPYRDSLDLHMPERSNGNPIRMRSWPACLLYIWRDMLSGRVGFH